MRLPTLKNGVEFFDSAQFTSHLQECINLEEHAILPEDQFHEMLFLEKKRSKRSKKPFILMLINVNNLIGDQKFVDTAKSICSQLSMITREVDVRGFYKCPSIIGVLFTEIGDTDINLAKDRIVQKIYGSLNFSLDPEVLKRVDISFHINGEQTTHSFVNNAISLNKYPNLLRHCPSSSHLNAFMRILNQRFILFVGDLLLVALAYGVASLPAAGSPLDLSGTGSMQLAAILLLYSSAFFVFDLYNTARSFRSAQTVVRLVVAVTLAGVFSVLLFYLVPRWHLSPTHLGIQNTVVALLVMAWRLIFGKLFQVKTKKVGALVLGAGETGLAIYRLLTAPFSPYEVKGFLDDDPAKVGRVVGSPAVVGTLDQLGEVAAQMGLRTAILALPRNRPFHLTRKILEARLHGMEILEMPAVYEKITGRMPVQHIEDQWLLFSEGFSLLSKEYVRKLKRIMDILVSGFLLIVTAPVMALTALAIRLESAGPIFYHQDRVGEGGDPFTLLKFRSMRRDAEEQGPKWAQKRDPRITRVGRLIRPFHIDELPQIWNVFKGDMSLVGPRPERPEFVRELEQRIPYYCVRHAVPPGITGWAQVNYPYGASEEDAMRKLEYDLYYLKNMSLLLDLKILLRTIGVVLMSEGSR